MTNSRKAPSGEMVFQRGNLHTGEKMSSATFKPTQFRPATPEFNQLVKVRLEDFELEEDARYEAALNRGEHPPKPKKSGVTDLTQDKLRPGALYAVVTTISESIRQLVRFDLIDDEIRVVTSPDIRKVKHP